MGNMLATNREVVCLFMIFYLRKLAFFVAFASGVGEWVCEWRQIGSICNMRFFSVLRSLATNREVFVVTLVLFWRQIGRFMFLFYIGGAMALRWQRKCVAFAA